MTGPFTANQIFSKISFPAVNILDALASLTRELSWDLTAATGEILGTTSAARTPSKPFIVGLIPPDVAVNFVPTERSQSTLTTIANNATPAGPTTQAPPPKGFTTAMYHTPAFYQQLSKVAASIGASPADMLADVLDESGTNPKAQSLAKSNGQPVAVGLIQFTQASAVGLGTTQQALLGMSDTQQLPFVQKYYQNANYGGTYPSTGSLYLATFAPGYLKFGNNPNAVIFTKANGGENYSQNSGLDHGNKGYISVGDMTIQMDAIKQTPAYQQLLTALNSATNTAYQYPDPTIPNPSSNPVATTSIMTNSNVTDADFQDPLAQQLGRNIVVSDKRAETVRNQTNYLRDQISLIQSIPALIMLVNPSEFTRNYEQTTDPVKTRSGYAINMWLEKPVSISAKGVTAGQYAFRSDGSGGLSSLNRIQSVSYQNLMSLVSIFKNNGNIFTDTSFGDGNAGIPLISMSVYIYYDNHIYIGSFDDFSITDDGNKPFNLSYSWKFTVRYDIDTNQVSDSFITTFGMPAAGFVPAGAAPAGISNPNAGEIVRNSPF